jgi:tetratricopeptide (TPR) repeat protein
MRGRALAYLANAKRVHTSDLPQVELLLGQAHEELAQGTGDPLELFHVLSFERALRMRQQRYQEALALCARQRVLAERVNDRHLLGKALQDTGLALRELERFEEALDSFLLAEECFDPVEDARSLSAARFNRIGTLDDLGRRREALAEIEPLRMLLLELGDRLNLLRLRAMEGEFALSLHDHALAEHCFREARNGFIALDIGWEAAEVSLYLAQALLLAGRTRETKELAEQILPIFRSASLTTEAVAAILLFREALLSETVSLQLIRHTLDLLREEQQHKQSSRS